MTIDCAKRPPVYLIAADIGRHFPSTMNGIELNALHHEQNSPLLESGLKSSFINDRRDDEEDFSENGDDEEALLSGSNSHRERNDNSFDKPGRWPQIKDIVIEVNCTCSFLYWN